MKIAKSKISDVCELKYGKALKSQNRSGGMYPVYGSSGIVGYHNEYLVDSPTLIIGRKGSVGEIHLSDGPCWPIDTTYYLEYDPLQVDLAWFRNMLINLNLKSLDKSAAVPGLNRNDVYRLEVHIPVLKDQVRIAYVLSKAEALVSKRKEGLQLLDELLRSTFLQMFGDPIVNPYKFPIRNLKEFYVNPKEGTKCGPFGSALKKHEYLPVGIPVWSMDNISKHGTFIEQGCLWISEAKFNSLANYHVINGDVIISRAGTVGKMCVVNTRFNSSIISTNLIRVRFGNNLLPLYFVSLMNYCKSRVAKLRTGSDDTFTHMNTGVLDTVKFPYPPIELQRKFNTIVKNSETLRAYYESSLQELENLYGSLSQRAFKGKLLLK